MTDLEATAAPTMRQESKDVLSEMSTAGASISSPVTDNEEAKAPATMQDSTSVRMPESTTNVPGAVASAPEVSLSLYNAAATSTTSPPPSSAQPTLSRLDSVAIGPSSGTTPAISTSTDNPTCIITLLLTSGARHPYKLDEKYLTKRNVEVPDLNEAGKKDPFSISVYTLKELILREWRDEWEAKPSSPSSIRLIHFGRLLDDKTPLKGMCIAFPRSVFVNDDADYGIAECRFNADTPNVVHMTVKPQDIVDDEEALRGKTGARERESQESTPGCRCVMM